MALSNEELLAIRNFGQGSFRDLQRVFGEADHEDGASSSVVRASTCPEIPFIVRPPGKFEREIECLPFINGRVRWPLIRAGVTTVAGFLDLSDTTRIRGIGSGGWVLIRAGQEKLRNYLSEHWQPQSAEPVLLNFAYPSETERRTLNRDVGAKGRSVIKFMVDWQTANPGLWGAQKEARIRFNLSRQSVSQIVRNYEKRTGESLRPNRTKISP